MHFKTYDSKAYILIMNTEFHKSNGKESRFKDLILITHKIV